MLELAQKCEVTGYPTLKIFRKGRVFDYNGGRDKWGFVNHMAKMQGPATEEKMSTREVKEYLKEDDVTIFGFFDSEDTPEFGLYEDAG